MAEPLVLGMSLDAAEDDPIRRAQPLSAFVVVKALDDDGEIMYLAGATEGLNSVECLGMAELAVIKLKAGLERRHCGEGDF